jgi:hypothetical protein
MFGTHAATWQQHFSADLFCAIVFFNEADTLESSSILIYYFKEQSIYTQEMARLIKMVDN